MLYQWYIIRKVRKVQCHGNAVSFKRRIQAMSMTENPNIKGIFKVGSWKCYFSVTKSQ